MPARPIGLSAMTVGDVRLTLLPDGYHRCDPVKAFVGSTAADFEEALRILPQLDSSAFFECIYPFQEFHQAWTAARSGKHLKVVLQVNG